jgi:hypothetical protein
MTSSSSDERFFAQVSDEGDAPSAARAPSRLKSRIYSALIRKQQETGPLLGLTTTKQTGGRLCVFESLVEISPLTESQKCFNLCSVCHARVLGEHVENAPIFWANCPYVAFQKR